MEEGKLKGGGGGRAGPGENLRRGCLNRGKEGRGHQRLGGEKVNVTTKEMLFRSKDGADRLYVKHSLRSWRGDFFVVHSPGLERDWNSLTERGGIRRRENRGIG